MHKKSLEYYKYGLEAAGKFGASVMQITCCGGAWDRDPRYALERAVESLRILGPVAANNGVTLTVRLSVRRNPSSSPRCRN